jgi:hypothetical protein
MSPRPGARVVLVAVALAAVAAVAAGTEAGPGGTEPSSASRPVVARTLVCPHVPAPTDGTTVRTSAVVAAPPGRVLPGEVRAGTPGHTTPVTLTDAGAGLRAADIDTPAGQPVVVSATGLVAGSMTASRLTRGTVGATRGWAWDRCVAPVADAYFAGVSTAAGTNSLLQLVDVDAAPVTVDIRLLTTSGALLPPAGAGITVPAFGSHDVDLVSLDAGQDALAVEVLTRQGRVASAITETREGIGPFGIEPVPQQEQPSSTVVLAGVPGSSAGTVTAVPGAPAAYHHTLVLAVPGGSDARVSVDVTDGSGRFVPAGLDGLTVSAGSARAIGPDVLDPALSGGPVTLRVRSSPPVPVLATLVLDASSGASDASERLRIGATPAAVGDIPVPSVAAGSALDTTVTLASYSGRATTATVTTEPGGATQQVPVPANGQATVSLGSLGGPGARLADVRPMAGAPPLYVAAVVAEADSDGPLLGGISLTGEGRGLVAPATVPDLTVPLRDTRD